MKRLLQLTLVLLITAGLTTVANAQDMTASANVNASINTSVDQALDFGSVTTGSSPSISPSDGNAGRFFISGNGGQVDLEFTNLPSQLAGQNDASGSNIPISFSSTSAAWGEASNSATNVFDPTSNNVETTTVNLYDASNGEIYVFIGGTLTVAQNQRAGNYQGTITLQATYN